MNNQIVLSSINIDELSEQVAAKVLLLQQEASKTGEKNTDLSKKSEKQYYSVDELCKLLGITRVTLFNWRKQGLITYLKLGKRTYFSEDDITRSMSRFDTSRWKNIPKQAAGGSYE